MGANCCAADDGQRVPPGEPVIAEAAPAEAPEPVAPAEQPAAEKAEGRVTVSIISARGLRNADWLPFTGKSDCYCVVTAVGRNQELFRTKVLNDTLEPIWNAESELEGWVKGDSLEFTIYDEDLVTSTKLGKVVLESGDYETAGYNGELPLSEAGEFHKAWVTLKIKMPGQKYPQGPPTEFNVKIEKEGKPLGFEFDVFDETTCYVVGINEGPIQTYNVSADPSVRLELGDFIMAVNGVEGTQKMLEQVSNSNTVEVRVRRSVEFSIAIARSSADQKVGLEIHEKIFRQHLLVTSVGEGLAKEWNNRNPDSQVRPGDRIVALNGKRGPAKELKKMLGAPKITQATLVRPASLPGNTM